MRGLALAATALLVLVAATPASADILLFKNGAIVECKIVRSYMKPSPPGQGGPKEHVVVKLEDGKEKEYVAKNIAQIIVKKPSWVQRAEDKDWYAKESGKVDKADWKKQEAFARQCKAKK